MNETENKEIEAMIDSTNRDTENKDRLHNIKGILLAIMGTILMSLSFIQNVKVNLLTVVEKTAVYFLIAGLIVICIGIYNKVENFPMGPRGSRMVLIIRGICGCLTYIITIYAFSFIDPADVTAIVNCNMLLVAILGMIFLSHKLTVVHVISLLLSILGVAVMSQSKKTDTTSMNNIASSNNTLDEEIKGLIFKRRLIANHETIIGILLSIASALVMAFMVLSMKILADKRVHYSFSILYASVLGFVLIGLTAGIYFILDDDILKNKRKLLSKAEVPAKYIIWQCFHMISSSVMLVMGNILYILAFFYESALNIAIIGATGVPISFLLQFLILNIRFKLFSILGGTFIFVGSIMVIISKFKSDKKAEA